MGRVHHFNLRRGGFTLIELSIVLVVIGLIAGGVLVGRDLVKAASIRAQISQLEKLETAIYTFKDKYSALPGDMPNATSIFGATDARGYTVANGNGDGTIMSSISVHLAGDCLSSPATEFRFGAVPNEVEEVFHHLNLASMGNYNIDTPAQYAGTNLTNLPDAVLGGGMLVTCLGASWPGIAPNFSTGTAIVIGGQTGGTSYSTRIVYVLGYVTGNTPMIAPDLASRLDAKIDDGQPLTGKVGVAETCDGWALPPSTYGAMAGNCAVSVVKKLWQ